MRVGKEHLMQAYWQDLRERVVRACEEVHPSRTYLTPRFHVATAWIRRLLQRRRDTASFAARPHGDDAPPANSTTPTTCAWPNGWPLRPTPRWWSYASRWTLPSPAAPLTAS